MINLSLTLVLLMHTSLLIYQHFIGCGWRNSWWTWSMWWMGLMMKESLLFDSMDFCWPCTPSLCTYCVVVFGRMWTFVFHDIGWWVTTRYSNISFPKYPLIIIPHIFHNLITSCISLLFLCSSWILCCQLSKVFNHIDIVIRWGQYVSNFNRVPFENEIVNCCDHGE